MNFGKLAIAVLKVVACTLGFAIAVSLLLSIMHHVSEVYYVWVWGGAVFGLCVGMCWAIKRREVRIAFVVPTLAGLLVCLVMVLLGSRPYFWDPWHMRVLLLGLLIGSVWALSRAGVFRTKQDQETPPTDNTEVDVIEQIRKLAELKSEGILTDGEFESKKQELLGRI